MIAEWNKKESYFSFLLNEGRIDWIDWVAAPAPQLFILSSSLFAGCGASLA